jgi:Putative translation initiation inhibitor, yjgF family
MSKKHEPSKPITRIEPGPRMSGAVVRGNMVWLAGQVGEGATVTEQCQSALAEVDRLLALAGTDKSNILTTQIWLADIADFAEMNAVWDSWVDPKNPPARATGEAKLATPAYKVEFIVTAAR